MTEQAESLSAEEADRLIWLLEDFRRRGMSEAGVADLKATHRIPRDLLEACETLAAGWCGTPFAEALFDDD